MTTFGALANMDITAARGVNHFSIPALGLAAIIGAWAAGNSPTEAE